MADHPEKLTWRSIRWPRTRFLYGLGLVLALAAGMIFDRTALLNGYPEDSSKEFQLMAQAWNLIDHYYVDHSSIRHRAMAQAAIAGMVESLGDTNHSIYLSRDQAKRAGSAVQGKLIGIGIEIKLKDHQVVVIAPMDGSPAQRAGIRAGDVLLQINGQSLSGFSLAQVSSRLMGEVGQKIVLTVSNPADQKTRQITVERSTIKLNNVSWQRLPGTEVAHLRLSMFSDGVTEDLRKALFEMQHAGVRKIIFDLRNNPGGALDEAIGVASQFLESGNVLWERDAEGLVTPVAVKPGGIATDMPMVLLVNGGSASDSEIVAGALHDAKRAQLIGERTFGTGTVLSEFTLPDHSSLYLAVEEWLTPNKQSFWHKGIEPDVVVAQPMNHPFLRPSAEKDMTATELNSAGDAQLLRALAVLNGLKH